MTDWAAAQREDPELDAALKWLAGQKRDDLKDILVEHMTKEEG